MGASKTAQYSSRQLGFARTAKAIGHPARVAIVQYLAEVSLATDRRIMHVTELSNPTVSQHLRELVTAGIVSSTFIGNIHYHQLTSDARMAVEQLQLLFEGNHPERG